MDAPVVPASMGRYQLRRVIGAGGMGIVFEALDPELDRIVAVKILRPSGASADRDHRMRREGQTMARLTHPNVLRVYDVGVDHGHLFVAMEHVSGGTLAEWLARAPRTPAEILAVFVQAGRGLAAAHDAGLVHRDFKPSNVLVADDGRALVTDFGLARTTAGAPAAGGGDDRTRANITGAAGTPTYMAPEQHAGAAIDARADQFTFCVAVWRALYGAAPFAGATAAELAISTAAGVLTPAPADAVTSVGPAVHAALERGLRPHPDQRFASMHELIAALAAAPASSPGPTAARRRRRWPVIAIPIAAIAAIVALWIAFPSARSPTPVAAAKCTSTAACSTADPAVCRPEVGCVPLRSPDCEPLADERALASDATVWIGALFRRTGASTTWGSRERNAVELARRDFTQRMGAASTSGSTERARPFGVIVCDDGADYRRAAAHLVEVGVPAVIGMSTVDEAIQLTSSVFVPNRILAFASLVGNPAVTRVPQPEGVPRLVWRTTDSAYESASAIAAWIETRLEPGLRTPGRPVRLAVIRPSNTTADTLGRVLVDKLRFNGTAALDDRLSYRELTLVADAPRDDPSYARVVHELLVYAPAIIVYIAPESIVESVFAPLEAQWPAGTQRPIYISQSYLSPELLAFVDASRERIPRFFGTTSRPSTAANIRFVTHYNDAFPEQPVTLTIDPKSSYDAFYLIAYATYAIPDGEPVTGERLAGAMNRLLPPGTPISPGLDGIFDAYAVLRRGGSIDFTGAAGNLDFDPATGESSFEHSILCVGLDPAGKLDGVESGLVYSAITHQLEGRMDCPLR